MERKQNAVDLTDLAIGIMILGIVVAIGATILLGIRDNRLTDLTTYTTANESVTGSTETATNLDNGWFNAITSVTNSSGGETLLSGNYSVTVDGNGIGQFILLDAEYNTTSLNVSYTSYNTSSRSDYTLANNAATGIAEYGNWFDIIVIVGVAAVILSLIFMAFGRRDDGMSQAY